jgi:hypothetical protein
MAKRKEPRSVCTYAWRDKSNNTLTEFKLHNYNGEGDDVKGIIHALSIIANSGQVPENINAACLEAIRHPDPASEERFDCSKLEITISDETPPIEGETK